MINSLFSESMLESMMCGIVKHIIVRIWMGDSKYQTKKVLELILSSKFYSTITLVDPIYALHFLILWINKSEIRSCEDSSNIPRSVTINFFSPKTSICVKLENFATTQLPGAILPPSYLLTFIGFLFWLLKSLSGKIH